MIISFTGHRPHKVPEKDKLGTGYSISNERVQAYSKVLTQTLVPLIEREGADEFYSGGAIGFDQIAFWTVEQLKKQYPHIQNRLSLPFKDQYIKWRNKEILEWYHKMIARADSVLYVDELASYGALEYETNTTPVGEYSEQKMKSRDRHLVDVSECLVACWNGDYKSGTGYTVKYANSKGKRVIPLQPIKF